MELKSIRELVRRGQLVKARAELEKLKPKHLARDKRLEAAYLAREAGDPERVLALLHPIIRPSQRAGKITATPEEKGEYAIALTFVGLLGEAKALLSDVALGRHPRVADALAFGCYREWDFKGGLEIITETLEAGMKMRESERLELICDRGLGLLYSPDNQFTHGDYSACRVEFSKVLEEKGTGFGLLRRYALRGIAISHLFEKNWDEFERRQVEVDRLIVDQGETLATRASEMWRTIATLGRALEARKSAAPSLARLAVLSDVFRASGEAGFAKSCVYHAAVLMRDLPALVRMYFSVSQEGARRRLRENLRSFGGKLPESHDRPLGPSGRTVPVPFDPWDDEALAALGLKQGQLPHRILVALARDAFTRPNLTHLFGLVFPDEVYRLETSDAKVAQGLVRLRQTLRAHRAPLTVSQSGGRFSLEASVPVVLRVPAKAGTTPKLDKSSGLRQEVAAAFGTRRFSVKEFEKHFKVSARTANYRLKEACEEGWLKRAFHGRATRYRVEDA